MNENASLDALQAEHGEIKVYNTPAGAFAIRRPTASEYQRFVDKASGDGSKFLAQKELVRAVRVYPTEKEAAASIMDAYPGLVSGACSEAVDMAGISFEAETRKG